MTDQEILEKAIEKAIANGWDKTIIDPFTPHFVAEDILQWSKHFTFNELFFNHDFAKSLWGGTTDVDMDGREIMADWQYHLQEMVIADDPIKYLGENID